MSDFNLETEDYYVSNAVSGKASSEIHADSVGVFQKRSSEKTMDISLEEDGTDFSEVELADRKFPNNNRYEVTDRSNHSAKAKISHEGSYYANPLSDALVDRNRSTTKATLIENHSFAGQHYDISKRGNKSISDSYSGDKIVCSSELSDSDSIKPTYCAQFSNQDNSDADKNDDAVRNQIRSQFSSDSDAEKDNLYEEQYRNTVIKPNHSTFVQFSSENAADHDSVYEKNHCNTTGKEDHSTFPQFSDKVVQDQYNSFEDRQHSGTMENQNRANFAQFSSESAEDQDNSPEGKYQHNAVEKQNHSIIPQHSRDSRIKNLGKAENGEKPGTEEEEDMDELFRVEMERMTRVSNKTIGSARQLSLPESLNSEATTSTGIPRSQTSTFSVHLPTSKQASPTSFSLFRNWSISAYRYTLQPLTERFRKTSTSNSTLNARAAALTESRAQCVKVANIAAAMAAHLDGVVKTQRALAREFLKLSIESPSLSKEFLCNADTNDAIHKNGAMLVDALRTFVAGINTLCNKTIDDTLVAVKNCEEARLEYEAYVWGLGTRQISVTNQQQLDEKRATYEKLLKQIEVKLELIEGNRIIVLRRQLVIFRNALSAYFSGNRTALEAIMKPIVEKSATATFSASR